MQTNIHLTLVDYAILLVYFGFVLGIGVALKRFMRGSKDFFLSGRSIPAWVTGLAFLSANLGAQEVIGMAASGAKYGIMTSHFYWVGAIPAMVFLAIFMMPFYYGSKARSVPEYLKLRFDEKTRGLNAVSFAVMTIFSSGISLHALAKLLETLVHWNYWTFKGGWIAPRFIFHSEMGQNFWMAIVAWSACFALTFLISLATRRTKSDAELAGLVYSLTPRPKAADEPWYQRPVTLGIIILAATLVLNLIFA